MRNKMTRKRILSILFVSILLLTMFAGCKDKEVAKEESSSEVSSEEVSIPQTAPEGMKAYENDVFYFQYRENLAFSEDTVITLTPPKEQGSKIVVANGTIGAASVDAFKKQASALEERTKSQNANASDFKFSEYKSEKSSNEAYVMTYKISQFGVSVTVTSYMIVSGGKGGPVVTVTDADDKTDVAAAGKKIVDTFIIKRVP